MCQTLSRRGILGDFLLGSLALIFIGGTFISVISLEKVQAQTPFRRIPVTDKTVGKAQFNAAGQAAVTPLVAPLGDDILAKSASCMNCHQGQHDPHGKETVRLGCTDCHGGNAQVADKFGAHVLPQ